MMTGAITAFLLGFWGSLHCVGMCGGIVGILNNSLADKNTLNTTKRSTFWLIYNIGRIFSYSIAGGIAAFVGSNLFSLINPANANQIGQMLSGIFMVAFGLYLADWWRGLLAIEKKGAVLWRHISPMTKKIIPVKHLHQAFLLGGLWGWLPCGLVYSVLIWMFTLPNPLDGMFYMMAFGLGTLPMLMLMSTATELILRIAQNNLLRKTAGVIVVVFGVLTFAGLISLHSGHNYTGHLH